MLAERAWIELLTGRTPNRIGNRGVVKEVVSDYFSTSDGGLILTLPNEKKWQSFCEVAEFAHLKEDPRFNPIELRRRNVEELVKEISKEFHKKTTQEWVGELAYEKGLVCSPVRSIDQALEGPEIEALRMVRQVDHPNYGTMKVLGIPFEFPEDPLEIRLAPPPLGHHTREVLKNILQMDDHQIDQLKTDGIIA